MKCLRCWKESKYEFCRTCKEDKHKAGAIISQNKKKLKILLDQNILQPELFNRFILYTDNIKKRWETYMTFVAKKHNLMFKIFTGTTMLLSVCISLWSIFSLIVIKI